MLKIHVLNVGQGDSIIIEYIVPEGEQGPEQRHFGLVDSNCRAGETPKALLKLQQLGVDRLSFVCITHPHADHYRGMRDIFKHFRQRIDQVLLFPGGEYIRANAKDLAKRYEPFLKSDDVEVKTSASEFVWLLMEFSTNFHQNALLEITGPRNDFYPGGFNGVDFSILTPLKYFRGDYLEAVRHPDQHFIETPKENQLSISMQLSFRGHKILLGGDATVSTWVKHEQMTRNSGRQVDCSTIKLPHHGSELDCTDFVLDYLYNQDENRIALISAIGRKHPSASVLASLSSRSVDPYCTNLSSSCGGNVQKLHTSSTVSQELVKWANQFSVETHTQPCQGDIVVEVDNSGGVTVKPELSNTCVYRPGMLNFLPPVSPITIP